MCHACRVAGTVFGGERRTRNVRHVGSGADGWAYVRIAYANALKVKRRTYIAPIRFAQRDMYRGVITTSGHRRRTRITHLRVRVCTGCPARGLTRRTWLYYHGTSCFAVFIGHAVRRLSPRKNETNETNATPSSGALKRFRPRRVSAGRASTQLLRGAKTKMRFFLGANRERRVTEPTGPAGGVRTGAFERCARDVRLARRSV